MQCPCPIGTCLPFLESAALIDGRSRIREKRNATKIFRRGMFYSILFVELMRWIVITWRLYGDDEEYQDSDNNIRQ